MQNIYIFIAIALDESIFLDVLHFPMKNIKPRDLEATPMGGATSKPSSDVHCLLLLSVAYRHDVKRENLTFWLFSMKWQKLQISTFCHISQWKLQVTIATKIVGQRQ